MLNGDLIDDIMAYEQGELDGEAMVELFQRLVDDGTVWKLQGSYGRTARDLIRGGYVFLPPEPEKPHCRAHLEARSDCAECERENL